MYFLPQPRRWDCVSDDANDTLLGSGARTFFIEGLDTNYDYISETINFDGLTPVTTINSYLRVWGGFVATAGGTMANEGELVCDNSVSGDILIGIGPNVGVSKLGQFTIPAGQTGYVIALVAATSKTQGIQFRTKARLFGGTFIHSTLFESNGAPVVVQLRSPNPIPEKTDFTISAKTQTGSSSVSVTYEFVLVDN